MIFIVFNLFKFTGLKNIYILGEYSNKGQLWNELISC